MPSFIQFCFSLQTITTTFNLILQFFSSFSLLQKINQVELFFLKIIVRYTGSSQCRYVTK